MERKKSDLLDKASFGYADFKIVKDKNSKNIEYIFLELNSEFERIAAVEKNRFKTELSQQKSCQKVETEQKSG